MSTAGCTWETGSRGGLRDNEGSICCESWRCSTRYGPLVVAKLRAYYTKLDGVGQRAFLAQRTAVGTPDAARPIQDQRLYEVYLEHPVPLEQKLARVGDAGGENHVLPAPHAAELGPVCRRWMCFSTGGNNDTTYDQRLRAQLGPTMTVEHLDLSRPKPARKPNEEPVRAVHGADLAIAWLKEQAECAVILPDHDQIVLPWRSRAATHAAMVRDLEARLGASWANYTPAIAFGNRQQRCQYRYGNYLLGKAGSIPVLSNIISKNHFCRVWRRTTELQAVVVRRWIPFAKCTECTLFRDIETSHYKRDRKEKAKAHERQRRHIADVRLERRHYHSNRLRAILDPEVYLSIIIDGADQGCHLLPHFCNRSHLSDEAVRQHLYAYGAISHGRKAYTFLVPGHVGQGHNVSIEVLWRILNDVLTEEGRIPKVLLLQLDNTTKQNKGRFFFAFLALLVHHNVFDKVIVSFLPVGHTHEDIDQMFSRFAQYLRTHNARSRAEMANAMRNAFVYNDKSAQVHILSTVANMSDYLSKGIGIELPECMSHRHFRIRRDKQGKVIIQGRSTPIVSYTTEPWLGLEGNTSYHDIFPNFTPNLIESMNRDLVPPAKQPKQPVSAEMVKKMQAGLERMHAAMPQTFTEEHYNDCMQMTSLYEDPMAKFQWDRARVAHFFSGAPVADPSGSSSVDECDASLPFPLQMGAYYLVRPPDDANSCPFWIAEAAKRGQKSRRAREGWSRRGTESRFVCLGTNGMFVLEREFQPAGNHALVLVDDFRGA